MNLSNTFESMCKVGKERSIISGEGATQQVIRADCPPACLSSTLCGFFEAAFIGRAAAQFQRSASIA
jgi:hypothetical protein